MVVVVSAAVMSLTSLVLMVFQLQKWMRRALLMSQVVLAVILLLVHSKAVPLLTFCTRAFEALRFSTQDAFDHVVAKGKVADY